MKQGIILLFTCSIMTMACGPSKYVAPLEQGQWGGHASLGGPFFDNLGYPMPIPLTAIGAGYGLRENLTVFTDVQVTEAAFGVVHLNVGGTYYVNEPNQFKPGLSTSLLFNNAISTWDGEAKIWPQIDLTARWRYGNKQNLWYAGLNSFFELSGTRAHGQPQPRHWIPAVLAGHVFTGEKWDFNMEAKYIAPFDANNEVVVDYIGPGDRGTFGLYFGITKKFGK